MERNRQLLLKLVQLFKMESTSVSSSHLFIAAGKPVGVIRDKDWKVLSPHTDALRLTERGVEVVKWKTEEEITDGMDELLVRLRKMNLFTSLAGWRNEKYDVARRFGEDPVFQIERAATFIFGTKRYGVHINGYVEQDGKIEFVWLQRRSKSKEQFPGKLDVMVSGGLEAGSSIVNCLIKEAFEEASIPEYMVRRCAKSVGHVSFMYEDDKGIYPEIIFCFDANLDSNFEPRGNDGEVDEFVKIPFNRLMDIILDSDTFKLTSAPIVLDFLIRHHVIDASYGTAYFEAIDTIHQPLYNNYPPLR